MSSFCILLGRLLVWRMMRKLTRSTKPNTDLIYRASTYKLPTIFLMVKARFPNPLEGYVPVVSRIVGPRGVKILHYPLLLFVFHRHSLYHLHSPQQQHKSSRTSFLKSFEISTLHWSNMNRGALLFPGLFLDFVCISKGYFFWSVYRFQCFYFFLRSFHGCRIFILSPCFFSDFSY